MERQRCLFAVLLAVTVAASGVARAGEPVATPPPVPVPAAAPSPPAPVEDALSIYVVTFGPGDHPFFKFGHDALLVRDRVAGTDKVYNFGTFAMSPGIIGEFLKGRLVYWLSVTTLPVTLASYQAENRTIALQELALSPEVKRELRARLDENARPENRAYRYDYFLDNCATRVRDAIDRATGGAVRASARAPGRLTLRGQALRMTADVPWLWLALDLVLAGSTDRPIDRWGEMYIPEELARGLRAVSLPGPNGAHSLVASEQTLFTANRPPPLDRPPVRFVTMLLIGLAIALLFVAVGWAAHRTAARALLGLLVSAWGAAAGFVGGFLVYVWAFTDHVVAHRNENIFQCAPWAVILLPLGLGVAFGSRRAAVLALRVAVATLLFALLGWAFKAVPVPLHQQNASLIALLLPPWFGMSIALLHVKHNELTPR
jgi:hypothetical protein